MREIKFRAWDGERLKPIVHWFFSEECLTTTKEDFEVDEVKISQYTGLKDKDGVEIFEGDIVKGKHRIHEDRFIKQNVSFLNGCFMFGNWNAHEYFNQHQHIKVVGNIYEVITNDPNHTSRS